MHIVKKHFTKIYLNFLFFFVFNSTLLSLFLHTYGDMLIFSLECKQVLQIQDGTLESSQQSEEGRELPVQMVSQSPAGECVSPTIFRA